MNKETVTSRTPRIAIIVDAYSAGNFLPGAFAQLQTQVVHVQSTPDLMTSMLAPDLTQFLENVILPDGVVDASVIDQLRAHAPLCVVAGQESAVPLADELSERLGLPSNGTRQSNARRNKFEMIEALRDAGVRCAEQRKGSDAQELADWADTVSGYPAVIKPLNSAATDGVFICADRAEVVSAAERVLKTTDIFGNNNEEVLIQSYLKGPEYIVDTVSSAGSKYVCGIWKYEKNLLPSGQNIYDKDVLIDPRAAVVESLVSYVFGVLDALGIKWGPAHAEVIVTSDGPVLVEVGARLNGNMHPGFHDKCLGHNQAALSAEAYLRPEAFQCHADERTYRTYQPAIVYNVPTTLTGTIESINDGVVDEITALSSVYLATVKLKRGSSIRPTIDLLTTPMRVLLTSEDTVDIDLDYDEVRRLKDSVFHISSVR